MTAEMADDPDVIELAERAHRQAFRNFPVLAFDIVRDADLMADYRRAGIVHVYVGVEATSQHPRSLRTSLRQSPSACPSCPMADSGSLMAATGTL